MASRRAALKAAEAARLSFNNALRSSTAQARTALAASVVSSPPEGVPPPLPTSLPHFFSTLTAAGPHAEATIVTIGTESRDVHGSLSRLSSLPGGGVRFRIRERQYSAAASLPSHQEIAMPSLSPTMTQGNIAKWVKAVGDEISAGDVLCEIETDKATLSMESMEDGFLAKILLPEGSKDIPVGTPIGVMVDSAEDVPAFADYTAGGGGGGGSAPAASATSAPSAPPSDLPPYQPIGMPSLSPTMTQGNIAKWRKAVGDSVASGDVLAEIETDKATLDMESMEEGFIAKILYGDGSKDVPVGTPIAVLVEDESYIPKFASFTGDAAAAPPPPPPSGGSAAPAAPSQPPADLPKFEEVGMPSLSPTMTQGNIAKWRKTVGDKVSSGDVLCEIETDKATLEMESMEEGYIAKILHGDGSKDVPVGTPIAILVDDEGDIAKFANYTPGSAPAAAAAAPAPPPPPPTTAAPAPAPAPTPAAAPPPGGKAFASPAAKKLAADSGVDVLLIRGTGPGGRIIKADVEDYLKSPRPAAAAPAAAVGAPAAARAAPAVPPSEVRKEVAAKFVQSVQTIPHYYLSVDTKVDKILKSLEDLNSLQSRSKGAQITLEHVIIKAAAAAAKKVPACNSSWAGDVIHQFDQVDISLSVYTDYGLVSPVLRNADSKGLAVIAEETERLKAAALSNTLSAQDTQGGTFSVASVAEFGLKSCSSIITPPQACILTVGAVQSRVTPGASANEFGLESVVTATLSCDHRVVDGAVGAEWLGAFKAGIEDPLALLL